jgi:hypothetical protein
MNPRLKLPSCSRGVPSPDGRPFQSQDRPDHRAAPEGEITDALRTKSRCQRSQRASSEYPSASWRKDSNIGVALHDDVLIRQRPPSRTGSALASSLTAALSTKRPSAGDIFLGTQCRPA